MKSTSMLASCVCPSRSLFVCLFPSHILQYISLISLNSSITSRDIVCTSLLVNSRFLTVLCMVCYIALQLTQWPSFVLAPICQHMFCSLDAIHCWHIINDISLMIYTELQVARLFSTPQWSESLAGVYGTLPAWRLRRDSPDV